MVLMCHSTHFCTCMMCPVGSNSGRLQVLPLRERVRAVRGPADQHRRHLRLRDRLLRRQPLAGGRREVQRPLTRLLLLSPQGTAIATTRQ